MSAFTIEAGRGRITLNSHADKGHLAMDVDGAGYSVFLTPSQMNELADQLRERAWRLAK